MEKVGLKFDANLKPNDMPISNCDQIERTEHSQRDLQRNSVPISSQFAIGHCFPTEHQQNQIQQQQQREDHENSLSNPITTPWNRSSFIPSTDFPNRLLSSPEASQSFVPKNEKKLSVRRSLSSELEKSAMGDGKVQMGDWELTRLSVRELNQRLVGQDRSVVSAVKQKRRTLKNRGYALNCRTRRMRNQQQLETENNYLRQLVAKQSAILAKYEQKTAGRGKSGGGIEEDKEKDPLENKSKEKWHRTEGEFGRQNMAGGMAMPRQTTVIGNCSSDPQMCTAVPFVQQYNGTANSSSSSQQVELFHPLVYQPQQFSATQLQLPYYHAMFRGNGTDEAAASHFQNWTQFR